jgi:hypothetical protein
MNRIVDELPLYTLVGSLKFLISVHMLQLSIHENGR